MEITRRRFNRLIVSVAILSVAWGSRPAARKLPKRFRRATSAPEFPGRLRPLEDAEVRHQGKWKG
ncbi:MAG: hypothetical protein WCS01_10105 [bacterium]